MHEVEDPAIMLGPRSISIIHPACLFFSLSFLALDASFFP